MTEKITPRVIGITGKIGSGKSTLASFLVKKGYTEYSLAKPLKKIGEIFGFSKNQLYGTQEQKLQVHPKWGISSREFLQKVGTDLFRVNLPQCIPDMKIDKTVWVDLFKMEVQKNPDKKYVISDVRFLDEASAIKELGGIIIRTVRENSISTQSGSEHVHVSEQEMDQIVPDYTVDNNKLSLEEAEKYANVLANNCLIWWVPSCAGGIGDRLLGMASTLYQALLIRKDFLVKWDHTDLSPVGINKIWNFYTYNPPHEYLHSDTHSAREYFRTIDPEEEWQGKNILMWSNQNLVQYYANRATSDAVDNIIQDANIRNMYIASLSKCVQVCLNQILEIPEEISEDLPVCDIGIHIRTHDNQIYDKNNEKNQENYIRSILTGVSNHIKKDPNWEQKRIFIASDCLLAFEIAKDFFPLFVTNNGPIVHSGTQNPHELSTEGISRVFRDLLTLAKQPSTLYIGWHTNFSRVAGMYDLNRKIYRFEGGPSLGTIERVDPLTLCNYVSESGSFRM